MDLQCPGFLFTMQSNVPQLECRGLSLSLGLRLSPGRVFVREHGPDVPAGHQAHRLPLADLVDAEAADRAPVAEDRHAICERPDLLHTMGDDDIVVPSLLNPRTRSNNFSTSARPREEVASSRIRIFGLIIVAFAISTICC